MGCFVLFWVGSLKSLFVVSVVEIYILRKWFRNDFLKIEASVGHPQRRSVPRKDQSAEKKVMPKSPRKCTSFRETKVPWLLSYQLPQKLV